MQSSPLRSRSEWAADIAEIRQLACRYALAVDSRDMAGLVRLFVVEVRVGREGRGREALEEWYSRQLSRVGPTIHFVGNHTIDFGNQEGGSEPAHATGVVYCREEFLELETGAWRTGTLQYWDDYERGADEWLFVRRRVHRWYAPTVTVREPLEDERRID